MRGMGRGFLMVCALTLGVGVSGVAWAGQTPPPADQQKRAQAAEGQKAEVEKVRRTYVERFNAKDAAGATRLFADDAVYSVPNQPPAKGRAAIQKLIEEGIKQGLRLDVSPELTQVAGEWAFDAGTSRQRMQAGPAGAQAQQAQEMRTSYIVLLRRQAGDWRIVRAVISSDQPPPGQHQGHP